MNILNVYPKNENQLAALKALFDAFDINFEETKSTNDPEFVKMIHDGDEDLKAGKGVKVDIDDLWK